MSAMPAEVTELTEGPPRVAAPSRQAHRAERRAALKVARRSRRRWTILSCCIRGGTFAATVGVLGVLH
jgi:hypothetical protein